MTHWRTKGHGRLSWDKTKASILFAFFPPSHRAFKLSTPASLVDRNDARLNRWAPLRRHSTALDKSTESESRKKKYIVMYGKCRPNSCSKRKESNRKQNGAGGAGDAIQMKCSLQSRLSIKARVERKSAAKTKEMRTARCLGIPFLRQVSKFIPMPNGSASGVSSDCKQVCKKAKD